MKLQCRISCNILVLISPVVFAIEAQLLCAAPQDTDRILLVQHPLGIAGFLYLLGIAKSRKMILAYVTRFLLLRFQKFSIGTMPCFHPHLSEQLCKRDSFFNRRYDGIARTRPTSISWYGLYLHICMPFCSGLGHPWHCGCFSAEVLVVLGNGCSFALCLGLGHPWHIGCFFEKVLACSKSFLAKAAVSYICHGAGSRP